MNICRLSDFPEHIDEVTRWTVEEWPEPAVAFADRRKRVLDPPECPATLLALSDGRPVGALGFARFRRKGDDHQSLFIDFLYVDAPSRRRGIGTALLAAAVTAASAFEAELFVYTHLPKWYGDRGWVVRQTGPAENRFVLSRELSRL